MNKHKQLFTITNAIIIITILMYFVQTNIEYGALYMGLNIYFFNDKLYYQILSSIFTHKSYSHLFMNMIVLWQFGNLLENYVNKYKFLVIYITGGVLTSVGTLAYMHYLDNWTYVVGASGAISVIFGYIAMRNKSQRKGIITIILLISFIPLLMGINVAWYSHIIGFIIGWIFGYLL